MQAIANPDSYGLDGSNPIHVTAQGWENADCCSVGDGVTINDALAIQKFTLKLIDELPEKRLTHLNEHSFWSAHFVYAFTVRAVLE